MNHGLDTEPARFMGAAMLQPSTRQPVGHGVPETHEAQSDCEAPSLMPNWQGPRMADWPVGPA